LEEEKVRQVERGGAEKVTEKEDYRRKEEETMWTESGRKCI
jgi:hypothetical protein